MDFTTIYQLSYRNILAINIESDVNMGRAIPCFIITILTFYFLAKGNLFVFERRNEKKLYEKTLMDKNILNRTVVLLMCKLLQSDKKEMYANKITFVVNYIRTSFDKQMDIENLINSFVFNHSSSQSVILNEKIYKHIRKIKRAYINPQRWFRELKNTQDHSVYEGRHNLNEYDSLPDNEVNELALSLVDYLSEDQKKYLSYLLFQMVYLDGNINKQEESDLGKICVDKFLTSKEFNTLKESFESKSEDKWFNMNLKEKNPELYSDPEVVSNIFPKDTENDKGISTRFIVKNNAGSSNILYIFLFIHVIISTLVITGINDGHILSMPTIILAISFLIYSTFFSEIISDKYGTIISRKDYINLVKEYLFADITYIISFIFIFFI